MDSREVLPKSSSSTLWNLQRFLAKLEDSTLGLVRGEERRFAKSSQANLDNNTFLSRIVSLGLLHIAQAPKSSLSSSIRIYSTYLKGPMY